MAEPKHDEPVCLYCGKAYPLGSERCPHCQAPAHIRPQDRTRRFRIFFVLLVLACAVLILWLPR